MKKILIFGSKGMLGHLLLHHLRSIGQYEVIGSARNENHANQNYSVDVREDIEVEKILQRLKPDVVINCVGILVQQSEKNIEDAILINSLFPNLLSRLGEKYKYKLIHISTDCVFSGKKGNYSETSIPDAESVYGRTKVLGELIKNNNLTIRTSIIGPELNAKGTGLFNWFLQQNGKIGGFTNAFWTGVTTLELAKGISKFISQDTSGIYHFVPGEKISKYELLLLFKKIWKKDDIDIYSDGEFKTDKSLLSNRMDLDFHFKTYEEMLLELKEWTETNSSLYPSYQ